MSPSDNKRVYLMSRALHWLSAILFLGMLFSMPYMLDNADGSSERKEAHFLHISFGLIFVSVFLLRLIWILKHKTIGTKTVFTNKLQERVAYYNHLLLYGFMFLIPVTGVCMVLSGGKELTLFGLFEWIAPETLQDSDFKYLMKSSHLFLIEVVFYFVLLHIAGAATHYFKGFFNQENNNSVNAS